MDSKESLNKSPLEQKRLSQRGGSPIPPIIDGSLKKDVISGRLKDEERVFLPIFGSTLTYSTVMSMYSDHVYIPKVVRDCVVKIEEIGITEEGIYRKSGSNTVIERLKRSYNEYQDTSLENIDVCAVASLLKLYIRELPETIFTNEYLLSFEEVLAGHNQVSIDIVDEDKLNDLVDKVKVIFEKLPIENKTIIIWLSKHLNNVVGQSLINKMDLMNVTIVFSPNLRTNRDIFWFFVKFHKKIFGDTILPRPEVPFINPTNIESKIEDLSKEVENLIGDFKTLRAHKKSELMDRIYEKQQYLAFLMRRSSLIETYFNPVQESDIEEQNETKSNINRINSNLRDRNARTACQSLYLDGSKLRRYTSDLTQTEIFFNINSGSLKNHKKTKIQEVKSVDKVNNSDEHDN